MSGDDGSMTETQPHGIQSDLREMWRTRPVRTPDDSKIAGVCGGFGRRYGVDPVLFRVAFVVTALWGGAGVFLYALMWLLLRSAGDEASSGEALLGKGRASGSKVTAVILVVVVLLSAPTIGGSGESLVVGVGFLLTAALLAGWYGLYRRTPEPPAGWMDVSSVPPAYSSGADAPFRSPVPPSWDPLGAAPFAWDLPEPGADPSPVAPARPRSRLTTVTLGLALIAVAVSVGLSRLGGFTWLDATRIAAIALAVVAGGLLTGAITRRGHGLLVVAGPLAGFVLLASLVQAPAGGWEHIGEKRVEITVPAQLEGPIVHEIGTVTVDMSTLELDRDRTYRISNEVGDVHVTLPDGLAVDATCRTEIGTVDCPDPADNPVGPVLTLDITNEMGSVKVTR